MSVWESSGHVKVERAKEHIAQLRHVSREFFDTNPYSVEFEPDEERERYVVRITPREMAPSLHWSAITADAIHNLRSALDILWRMAIHGRKPAVRNCFFPIYASLQEFEAKQRREPQHGRIQKAVHVLRATRPYKGGNDMLWTLAALDDRDKHEMLTLTVGTFRSLLIKAYPDTVIHLRPEDFMSPVEEGTVFAPLASGFTFSPVDMHHEFVFEITFAAGEMLEGETVLPVLTSCMDEVERVVAAFRTADLLM